VGPLNSLLALFCNMLDISFWGKNHLAGVDRGNCHVIEEEISLSQYLSPPRRLYSGRG